MKKTFFWVMVAVLCWMLVTTVQAADVLPESCPCCGKEVTWQPLSEPASNNTLTEGHYYVTKDLSGKAWYTEGKVCLYMNGKMVNGSNRVFYMNKNSTLNLMGEGNAIGNAFASGSTATGGVVYVASGATLNLHGPTIKNKGASGRMAKYGGVVYVTGGTFNLHSGAVIGGNATCGGTMYLTDSGEINLLGGCVGGGTSTSNGGGIYINSGTLKLQQAEITGGNSGASGGTLYLAGGVAELCGGSLTGGVTKTNGGNIFVKTGASLNIAGTQITGGACGNVGGGIYVGEKSSVVMSAGSVSGGTAGSTGGCIYEYTDAVFEMSGGTVGDGTADSGTSFYVRAGGKVVLSGDATVQELRYPSLDASSLEIHGKYTGSVTLKANSYPDGQIVGAAVDGDLSKANITVGDGSIYLVVAKDLLRLSKLGQLRYKTLQEGYCEACQKTVEWVLWDGDDCAYAGRTVTGHYRINVAEENSYLGQKTIGGTDLVCIDLNGKTLYADRAFDVNTGVLNIVDTVGGGRLTGQGVNTTEAAYGGVGFVRQNGEMNIYGGTYSYQKPTDGRHYINRGGVFYVQGEWNLYGGEIVGGAAATGGAVFGNAGTDYISHIGLYGGSITMGYAVPNVTSTGLCVMTRGTVDLGGNCRVEEILRENSTSGAALSDMLQVERDFGGNVLLKLPTFDGCEAIGSCVAAPQGIRLDNDSAAQFVCLDGQLLAVSGTPKVITYHENGSASAYETLAAAISAATVSDRLILMANNAEDVTVDKLVHLDLNGFTVSGSITGIGTLACMDRMTGDFTVADGKYGRLTGGVTCALTGVTADAPCSDDAYLMIKEETGISFHRICLQITEAVLRPCAAGIYYNGIFSGDELVAHRVESFGIALNIAEAPGADNMQTTSLYTVMDKEFGNANSTSCLLSGIMKPENGDGENLSRAAMPVHAGAYARLTDGTVLFGSTVSTDLQTQAAQINAAWVSLTLAQKRAFVEMFERYEGVMGESGWSVSNALSIAERKKLFESTDYTPYLAPWEENVVEKAKAAGKIHYYFMAGEGMLISETQSYKDKWGDATLVVFPNGQTLLIDSGPLAYAPVLAQNLQRMGVTHLDAILITHPHSDHQNGAFADSAVLNIGLLEAVTVDKVYYRGGINPDETRTDLVYRVCRDYKIPCEVIRKGDVMYFGDVKMECIWPVSGSGDGLVVGGEEINSMSVVVRFDYGEHSSLFTGDIYKAGEKMILEQVADSLLDVDFLKVPHHGYDTSSALEFLEAVSPKVAMAIGRLKIPTVVRNRYAAVGATLLDDRTNGYVLVTGAADGTLEYVVSRTQITDDAPEADEEVVPEDPEE